MEDDGQQKRLLVVDEKETCFAQFVPENGFEHIWNQESTKMTEHPVEEIASDESVEYDANKTESVKSMQGKVKPAENPLFRRKVVEEAVVEKVTCGLLSSPKEIAVKFDEIVRDGPKLYKGYLRETFAAISSWATILVQLIILVLGNRWAWNILVIIMKLSLAIFLYLVIACSTGIIAIIFNIHDAYLKLRLERSATLEDISERKGDLEVTSSIQAIYSDCREIEIHREEKTTAAY